MALKDKYLPGVVKDANDLLEQADKFVNSKILKWQCKASSKSKQARCRNKKKSVNVSLFQFLFFGRSIPSKPPFAPYYLQFFCNILKNDAKKLQGANKRLHKNCNFLCPVSVVGNRDSALVSFIQ